MLNALIVAEDIELAEAVKNVLIDGFKQMASFEVISVTKGFITEIKKLNPDFLICIDLVGFESVTFTDSIAYNLLGCKQIHLLLNDNLKNEHIFKKDLSIAMFFCVVQQKYKRYLANKYSKIPWITGLDGWEGDSSVEGVDKNKAILQNCVENILKECKLI